MSRVRFEVFTLGTLAIILAIGVVGYVLAAPVARREVDLPAGRRARPGGLRLTRAVAAARRRRHGR